MEITNFVYILKAEPNPVKILRPKFYAMLIF